MNERVINISGVGCCLVDHLYGNISFAAESFSRYLSRQRGDGGLIPGHLVFREEFESFTGDRLDRVLRHITHGREPDAVNIGGPGIVPLINASQLSDQDSCRYHFYGCGGRDSAGSFIRSSLKRTPVLQDKYRVTEGLTSFTIVLSDPSYNGGQGERIFINSIGTAWDYEPSFLGDDFFSSRVVVFGGTALVPKIHDTLTELLERAKRNGCLTIVNTVFDFRSEKSNPGKKWPLGKTDESYRFVDLLIMDREEALRLSGTDVMDDATGFFLEKGTGAVAVTNGADNVRLFSTGKDFGRIDECEMPVSLAISKRIQNGQAVDTTGCGDNFAGGVIASVVTQLKDGIQKPDLREAVIRGIICGGFSCFYMGGTYFEKYRGEKLQLLYPYYEDYKKQLEA